MAALPTGYSFVTWTGATTTLANASFKNSLTGAYKVNTARNGFVSFKPLSQFNNLSQFVGGQVYLLVVASAVTIADAVLTVPTVQPGGPTPLPVGQNFVIWRGTTTALSTSAPSWRGNVNGGIFKVNTAKNGFISYKPASQFNNVTQLVNGELYLFVVTTAFSLADAALAYSVPTTLHLQTAANARYVRVTFNDRFRQIGYATPEQGGAYSYFQVPVYTAQGVFAGFASTGDDITALLDAMSDADAVGAYCVFRVEPPTTAVSLTGGIAINYQLKTPGRPGGTATVTAGTPFDGTATVPTVTQPPIGGLSVDATARTATFALNVDATAGTYEFQAPGTTGYVTVPSRPFPIGDLGGTLLVRRKATAVNAAGGSVSATVGAASVAITGNYKVLAGGDSFTAGFGLPTPSTDNYFAQTTAQLDAGHYGGFTNFGQSGASLEDIITAAQQPGGMNAAIPDAAYDATISALLGGINCWLKEGGETSDNSRGDHVIAQLTLWHHQEQAAGSFSKTIACTIPNVGGKPSQITSLSLWNSNIDYVNAWIRANWSTGLNASALCDFAADSRLDPRVTANAANFQGDLFHPTVAGAGIMAGLMAPKIREVAALFEATPAPQFVYADSGADGIDTNMAVIANYGSNTRNNNVFKGDTSASYAELSATTTQFLLELPAGPTGSESTVTVTDASGTVIDSVTVNGYAASYQDSQEVYRSAVLAHGYYTFRVQNLATLGGSLVVDSIGYEGMGGNLSAFTYVDATTSSVTTNMSATGGYERVGAINGSILYGGPGSFFEYTTPVPVTALKFRSPLLDVGSDFELFVNGQSVATGTTFAATDQKSQMVYESGALAPAVHTIRVEYRGTGTYLIADGIYYKPA